MGYVDRKLKSDLPLHLQAGGSTNIGLQYSAMVVKIKSDIPYERLMRRDNPSHDIGDPFDKSERTFIAEHSCVLLPVVGNDSIRSLENSKDGASDTRYHTYKGDVVHIFKSARASFD